jgi:hypothetical protein
VNLSLIKTLTDKATADMGERHGFDDFCQNANGI